MGTSEREEPCHTICKASRDTPKATRFVTLSEQDGCFTLVVTAAYEDKREAMADYCDVADALKVTR
jgi:hypothetical protein